MHLLPFFHPIDGADAGFDPIDHTQVDPRLGDWDDVGARGDVDVMADVIVNHCLGGLAAVPGLRRTRRRVALRRPVPDASTRVFPDGATRGGAARRIYRPRPGLPFTDTTLATANAALLWTTFTPQQIDIDVRAPRRAALPRRRSSTRSPTPACA